MIAVITGDIINSRKVNPEIWLPKLKEYFSKIILDSEKWEIYRGDSFQIEVEIEKALEIAISIKALIKSSNQIDVRMSIGLGDKNFKGKKITESYGTAYINSGESFEKIKNNTLILRSPFSEFDDYFNPILKLLSFISDNWKPVTSETIFYTLTHRELLQKEIAERLSKDKTTINKALKRGGYDEIIEIIDLYSQKIQQWLN
ncbi:transcriptional regulator [Flavobacterium ajazii]|uniref:transcriptional regulator n=1 Tax=Flavobacterium ajazii TaxID=2692318 RepID=UPI0013D8C9BE|nr:transcriptional regulator [Flavobacterium ajazii]